ncbi:MAG: UbiA family prenyltransferase [Chitinophagaceae bacterium]
MNILKTIRSSEWWEYKLPPLLAIGYATVLQADKNIYDAAYRFAFLILSIIIGAVYVSLVNDITDMEEDKASGKRNRLSRTSPSKRWLLLGSSIVMGGIYAWFLSDDVLSLCLYLSSYIAFTLYSVPPFRLKKRGFAGVLADASGAHLFPSLLMVAGTVHFFNLAMNWMWFAAVGVWAFMYGLRGILWHQFLDRDNDLRIGLRTYATQKDPTAFKNQSYFIIAIELIALAVMLVCIGKLWLLVALFVYVSLLLGYKKIGIQPITIVPPADQSWHIVMSSYYQSLFPLALLFESAIIYPQVWIVMFVHVLLFPVGLKNIIMHVMMLIKIAFKRATT